MSIKIMTWVWEHSQSGGNSRLVLLSMADNANDTGLCWPSLDGIATRARVSVDTVRRAIRHLVDLGELVIEEQGSGRRNSHYRIICPTTPTERAHTALPHRTERDPHQGQAVGVGCASPDADGHPCVICLVDGDGECVHLGAANGRRTTPTRDQESRPDTPDSDPQGVADCEGSQNARGGTGATPGVAQLCNPRGGTAVLPEPPITVIEPSPLVDAAPSAPRPERRTRMSRASRIPDGFGVTDGMRSWAAENAPWVVDLDRETANFVDYWTSKSGQAATKRDWLATWRKWLRTASDRVKPWERQEITRVREQVAARQAPAEYTGDPTDVGAFLDWVRTQRAS